MEIENKRKLKYLGLIILLILGCVFLVYAPLTLFAKDIINFSSKPSFDEKILLSLGVGAFFALIVFVIGLRFLYKKYQKNK